MTSRPLRPDEIAHLVDRWEAMSGRYLPGRPRLIEHLIAEVRKLDRDPTVLDLGCGPASLLTIAAAALPGASFVGVDNDPVLLEIARVNLDRLAGRGVVVDSALHPGWSVPVCAHGPFDVVVAMLVLHYFPAVEWPGILQEIRSVLRPGGLLAVIEVVDDPHAETNADAESDTTAGPTWTEWWDLAASIGTSAWSAAFAARAAAPPTVSAEHHPSLAALTNLLERAGFASVDVCHRVGPAYLAIARTDDRSP